MGRFSDDEDVELALTTLEAEYLTAQEENEQNWSPEANAALAAAEQAFITARSTSRGGRTVSIITE